MSRHRHPEISLRHTCLLLVLVALAAAAACTREPPTDPSQDESAPGSDVFDVAREAGQPLPHLRPQELALFELGAELFQTEFTPETGLGPLFNARGCSICHLDPVVGGAGVQIETHATSWIGGECDEHDEINGGSVMQDSTTPLLQAAGMTAERLATELPGLATGRRSTPKLFGIGLLEAVPEGTILRLADPDDRDGDGISGRPNFTDDGALTRFGRKAQVPDLLEFAENAFIYEQGITSPNEGEQTNFGLPLPDGVDPAPDPELPAEAIEATAVFMRLLAPPAPLPLDRDGRRGRLLFSRIGCASCHVPALRTGPSPVSALSRKVVFAYTDLLLHDMGEELADVCSGEALPSEFRTEPLMGLRFVDIFLHDGRAQTMEEAVLLHGGEAQRSRDRFESLSPGDRAALLAFLASL